MVVSSNKIIEICGPTPPNYIKTNPDSNQYIFENDPSFAPINLYDFFGNGATVNSFSECAHYVNGGWAPNIEIINSMASNRFYLTAIAIVFALFVLQDSWRYRRVL